MAYYTTSSPVAGGFGLLVTAENTRHLLTYDAGTYDGGDRDVPARWIVLEPDEADQVAEILHNQPITDRLLALERRVRELIGERGHYDQYS